ncbi:cupin domain-containing protein [Agrobacterium vitis]|uniref:cupin domain-containing protein n=1 Tax=Agrobacterium vitis TaxID=373 RepID=UPI0015DB45CB|nr:cupin domain-containing protein [Agrobacterium vitis]MCF1451507.1 cupin domain-containing protein [Agrobacterium vitis]BCH53486.1 cupin [Agrobacterium vitis]
MPVIKTENAALDIGTAEGINAELGPYSARRLSDAGGLTQFGALLETLPPGSRSSHKHWHEQEDEFLYMLTGTATLLEGDVVTEMMPGDAATFKAGVALGHCLENRSNADCVYLVVGTRSANEIVHYDDKDMVMTKVNFVKTLTDRAGTPIKN